MLNCRINKLEQAFVYIADCNLATVSSMAMVKSRPKGEFKRQKNIAQSMIKWIVDFGVDPADTRAADVIDYFNGNVKLWAIFVIFIDVMIFINVNTSVDFRCVPDSFCHFIKNAISVMF